MTPDRFRFNPETMSLDPPHFKKVVYLDQFVISEIVNAIDPHAKAHARVDPFWRQAFEALEQVSKLQLVSVRGLRSIGMSRYSRADLSGCNRCMNIWRMECASIIRLMSNSVSSFRLLAHGSTARTRHA
jgi:hypothetical protein